MNDKWKHGGNVYAVRRNTGLDSKEIVDYSANINPLGLPDQLKETLVKGLDDLIHYPDPEYVELKEAIAKYSKMNEKYIQIGNGAIELLYMLMEYLQPQRACVIAPGFVEYERSLRRYGSEIDWIQLKEEEHFELTYESVAKVVDGNTDLVVLCNPNNPTGHLIERSELVKIINYCKSLNCSILIDEAFIDFVDKDQSIVGMILEYKNLYVLRSLTKFFAIPGLRLGYLLTSNEELHNWCVEYRTPWMVNHLANLAGICVLKDDAFIKESLVVLEKLRVRLSEGLKSVKGLKVFIPNANYIFIKLENGKIDLKEQLLNKGIMIRSCSNYHGLDSRYYRVAIKDQTNNEMLVKAINEIINT